MHKLFQFLIKVWVGLNGIDTPKRWIGDISEAPNRWYIDIAINDNRPTKKVSTVSRNFIQPLYRTYRTVRYPVKVRSNVLTITNLQYSWCNLCSNVCRFTSLWSKVFTLNYVTLSKRLSSRLKFNVSIELPKST